MNAEDVGKTYDLLAHNNETEIRLIKPGMETFSEFVSSREEFIETCRKYHGKLNVYVGINERKPGGKTKEDVISAKNMFLDIDPDRKIGTAATEDEMKKALKCGMKINEDMKKIGYKPANILMSGNGVQLWFSYPEIKITEENVKSIHEAGKRLQRLYIKKYSTNDVNIDQMGGLPRIAKVAGTLAMKGVNTAERPWRIAKWLNEPTRNEDPKIREKLLSMRPVPDELKEKRPEGHGIKELKIEDVADLTRLHKVGDEWHGLSPVHDGTTGGSFQIIPEKNMWVCHQHGTGGDPLSLIAVQEGILKCENAKRGALKGSKFKKTLKIAKEKYGLKAPAPMMLAHYNIAEAAAGKYNIKTIEDTREMWYYNDGVYQKGAAVKIKQYTQRALEGEASTHHTKEILGHVERMTYTDRADFNTHREIINLENGYINIDEKTGTLHSHTSDNLITYKIPVKYNPEANCPAIDKFFDEIVEPKDKPNLYEIIGYCLLYDHRLIQKAVALVGEESGGKSTYLALVETFLGKENICNVPIQGLNDGFLRAHLYGKLANIYADLPETAQKDTSNFRMATDGLSTINGAFKHKDSSFFISHAKHIYSANKLPKINHAASAAYYRRWHIITFPYKFEGENIDKYLMDKMTTPEELSGLLNKSLAALARLRKQEDYTNALSTEENTERYEMVSQDSEDTFLNAEIQSAKEDTFIAHSELYERYGRYCRDKKIARKGRRVLYDAIRAKGAHDSNRVVGPGEKKQVRVFNGVTWVKKEEISHAEHTVQKIL